MKTAEMIYHEETRAIIGCVYDVFNSLPRFAEEALCQEALFRFRLRRNRPQSSCRQAQ